MIVDPINFTTSTPTRAIKLDNEIYLNVTDMLGNMQMLTYEIEAMLDGKDTVPAQVVTDLMDGILQLLSASQSPIDPGQDPEDGE